MVAYLDLIAAMRDGHRQLDEFVAEGPRPDPFEGIDWGPIVAATTCPTCGSGGPTLGTDLPCDCPPPIAATCPECGGTGTIFPEPIPRYASGTPYECDYCAGTGNVAPDPEPDHLTACLAEARFGLEDARDLLDGVLDRIIGTSAAISTTVEPLQRVRAQIERAIAEMP